MAVEWIRFRPINSGGTRTATIGATAYAGRLSRKTELRVSYRYDTSLYAKILVTQLGNGNLLELSGSEIFQFPNSQGGYAVFNFNANIRYFSIYDDGDERIPFSRFTIWADGERMMSVSVDDYICEIVEDPGAEAMYKMQLLIRSYPNTATSERIEWLYFRAYDEAGSVDYNEELIIRTPGK